MTPPPDGRRYSPAAPTSLAEGDAPVQIPGGTAAAPPPLADGDSPRGAPARPTAAGTPAAVEETAARPLLEPSGGIPSVVVDPDHLLRVVDEFAAGSGPVAVDAERAAGFRYSQRAYLVQLRRAGAGTALIDPTAVPDLSRLGAVLAEAEWVLHAANQDIPCLVEVGLRPPRVFDTELAARLLNLPRVGLGPLLEAELGVSLRKEHSAADWSTRPLPPDWLRYAALDVELLIELRAVLLERLRETGKLAWALEEFAALAAAAAPIPRADPWRRVSGLHRIRDRRRLAIVRALWEERDQIARARDIAPGRVLPDAALVDAAIAAPASAEALALLPVFRGRAQRRDAVRWFAAIERGRRIPDRDLPPTGVRYDGPPPARIWSDRNPAAAARLAKARAGMHDMADRLDVPVENLITPDIVRRICWSPPALTEEAVAEVMRDRGARPWQVGLAAPVVLQALTEIPTDGLGEETVSDA